MEATIKFNMPDNYQRFEKTGTIDNKFYHIVIESTITPKSYNKTQVNSYKPGDFVVLDEKWISIYKAKGESEILIKDYCGCDIEGIVFAIGCNCRLKTQNIRYATDKEKELLLNHIERKGYFWNANILELLPIPKKGDLVIVWYDDEPAEACIAVFIGFNKNSRRPFVTNHDIFTNCIIWNGTSYHLKTIIEGNYIT